VPYVLALSYLLLAGGLYATPTRAAYPLGEVSATYRDVVDGEQGNNVMMVTLRCHATSCVLSTVTFYSCAPNPFGDARVTAVGSHSTSTAARSLKVSVTSSGGRIVLTAVEESPFGNTLTYRFEVNESEKGGRRFITSLHHFSGSGTTGQTSWTVMPLKGPHGQIPFSPSCPLVLTGMSQ